MKTILTQSIAAIAMTLFASSSMCQSAYDGSTYSRYELQNQGSVTEATVLQVRDVVSDRTDDSSSNIGTALGGVIGGLIAQNVGGGNGRYAAAALGALGGAYAGSEITRRTSKNLAWEIIVKTRNGDIVPVTQEADRYALRQGQHVYLLNSGGRTRVIPVL